VNDSSLIMSRLAAELEAATSSSGRGPRDAASSNSSSNSSSRRVVRPRPGSSEEGEEVVWRKWVDDRLVKVITANIYRSWE
jgi:microsomal prostaglandin-E synthase 2